MATYAAVISLTHLTLQIRAYDYRHQIFSLRQQRQLESLREKVSFLQDFLESYFDHEDSDDVERLESLILDVSYAAEDIIESYIVNDIHHRKKEIESKYKSKINLGRSTSQIKMEATQFSQEIGKVIESIDSIILKIKDKSKVGNGPHPKEPEQAGSLGGPLNIEKNNVVGFNAISKSIIKKLTVKKYDLQVFAITGMGGSGKSTLAKKVYDNRSVKQHFDVCGWVTVSQDFNEKKLMLGLLSETGFPMHQIEREKFEYDKFGHKLHKHLFGRRFFVIIDDIWNLDAWDRIMLYLNDSNKGSRILITTRLVNLANRIGSRHNTFKMKVLDETQSWNLLRRKVFGQESCPPEIQKVGKVIAENCKGLPLSIVVIGGLLRESIKREYWEYIAENINASVNLDENERCLKVLYTSYNHLPIHLKPCFLYLGVYPEDHEIRVSELIKLWVAERFLKPKKDKYMEQVAVDYVKDLLDRNLIFVTELGSTGNVKHFKVHDLLRDLCLREATKKRFLYVSNVGKLETSHGFNSHRRLSMCGKEPYREYSPPCFQDLESSSCLRSFICNFELPLPTTTYPLRLVSVFKLHHGYAKNPISKLVNSRYINFSPDYDPSVLFSGLAYYLWNLQTLILRCDCISVPIYIWVMLQLRHVIINKFTVNDPPREKYYSVLGKLQTLKGIHNFRCSKRVLRRIGNVKTLSVTYDERNFPSEYLKNLGRLSKLESLRCFTLKNEYGLLSLPTLEFSLSLKKLSLKVCHWNWEDSGEKVGSLPHLEMFKLCYFEGGEEWNSVEGRFPCLKYLFMCARSLENWTADDTSFPCLEHLRLSEMEMLEEIPSEIGDTSTLRLIEVSCDSSSSAIDSAKMILKEQRSSGNEDLLVTVDGHFYGPQSLTISKATVIN